MLQPRSSVGLTAVLAALAEPTRRQVYELIAEQPGLATSDICSRVQSLSRWGVMKHLGALRDAGLVQTMTTGRQRRHYAEAGALAPLRQWLGQH